MSAQILLSGASGLLGSALRRTMTRREIRFLQLVRRTAGPDTALWNPSKKPAVTHREAIEGCRAAIHLSGANLAGHRWTARYRRELVESRIASTRALAETLAQLHHPPEALLVSSAVGLYGDRGATELDEGDQVGDGFLAELCQQWEEAAEPARRAGIRVVHLRTGVILSPTGGALAKLLPAFRMGLGGPLAGGQQWMSWISLPDAVEAILFLIEHRSLRGPVNLVAPEPVTNAEFTRALGKALHRPTALRVPAFVLRLALGEMADQTLLASQRVLPSKLAAAGFRFEHPQIDRALAALLGTADRGAALS